MCMNELEYEKLTSFAGKGEVRIIRNYTVQCILNTQILFLQMKGLTEHFNQTMSPYLAKMINNDQQNWDKVNNSDRISNIKTIIHQTLALFHALPTTYMDVVYNCMLVVVLFV